MGDHSELRRTPAGASKSQSHAEIVFSGGATLAVPASPQAVIAELARAARGDTWGDDPQLATLRYGTVSMGMPARVVVNPDQVAYIRAIGPGD
jgi:hypothetical protein